MDKASFGAALAATPKAERARFLLEILDTAFETVGEEAVVDMLTGLFDSVLVPIDIPFTPEFIETRIEAIVRANIPAIVKRVHAIVHTP